MEHTHDHRYSGNVQVDISYNALKYLGALGYSRVKFALSEMNHKEPDVCDKVAARFQGSSFATLSSVLKKAPVFGNNPPAPIYGLTHPQCSCSYIVYPPNSIQYLKLTGNPSKEQKEEILQHMYPQQVWANSRTPTILDIDYSAFVNVTPKRPVKNPELIEQPWYQDTWSWIKNKIFRKASDYSDFIRLAHTRVAANNVRFGDLVRFIADYDFVTEFGIATPFAEGTVGLALADYNDQQLFVYLPSHDSVFPVKKDSLIPINNKDIGASSVCKKVRIHNDTLNEDIEGIVCGETSTHVMVYDFLDGVKKPIEISAVQYFE